ncbi:MAG TPA: hypothetical protein VFA76_16815 [Terriglobales bacterium]|nr:hypothetical protein [Terriglobales bacterium]
MTECAIVNSIERAFDKTQEPSGLSPSLKNKLFGVGGVRTVTEILGFAVIEASAFLFQTAK